jgi:hypothetical protein
MRDVRGSNVTPAYESPSAEYVRVNFIGANLSGKSGRRQRGGKKSIEQTFDFVKL